MVEHGYDRGRGAYYALLLARGQKNTWGFWQRGKLSSPKDLARLQRELRPAADFLEYLEAQNSNGREA